MSAIRAKLYILKNRLANHSPSHLWKKATAPPWRKKQYALPRRGGGGPISGHQASRHEDLPSVDDIRPPLYADLSVALESLRQHNASRKITDRHMCGGGCMQFDR